LRPTPADRQPVHLDRIHLGDLFSSIPATIWTTDERLVVTSVQGHLIRQWQVDPTRLIGRTIQDLLLDGREDHPFVQAHLAAIAGYDTPVRVEWGGRLYGVRLAPLRGDGGAIIGCVGVQQEVGWLPDDEETLRESDLRLRRVVDASMIGIAFGDDEGRITDANDAFLNIVGYTREDLMADGLSWPALTPVEHQSAVIGAIGEILATGRCRPFEAEMIRRDGRRVAVLVGAAHLSVERREGVAYVMDISDRKRAQRRVEAELALADRLSTTTAVSEAAQDILEVLVSLGWSAAAWWSLTLAGALSVVASTTAPEAAPEQAVEAMAARAVRWQPETQTLALPLAAGEYLGGVLLLVGKTSDPVDAELLDACARIARRIAARLADESA
jgi:PAS domain S-box-containing protein